MHTFWLLVALCCSAVFHKASGAEEKDLRINGANGWYLPQSDASSFQWVDMEKINSAIARSIGDLINPVNFLLYTSPKSNRGEKISTSDTANFNPAYPTIFLVHGFLQTHLSININKDLREEYFKLGNCNIIFVEWVRSLTVDYLASLRACPGVGKKMAVLIDALRMKYGETLNNNFQLVGHSLGAHVCGFAAKNVATGPIDEIIGLDPAGPGFDFYKPAERLNSTDAKSVKTIHTNSGFYGIVEPIGSSSYYFNGGASQPKCITNVCNHERSVLYWKFLLINPKSYEAFRCDDHESALAKECSGESTSHIMSGEANKLVEGGIFYVPTSDSSPYGTGPQ